MNIAKAEQIAHYLATYLRAYHDEYRLFVDSPPRGATQLQRYGFERK
jgi:hypothetical protein